MANKLDIFGAAAAIAKGMSVTFKEMMSPTVTEYYPDEPAKFEERYRGSHVLQRDENGLEKFCARRLARPAASTSKPPKTPPKPVSRPASVTPGFTTSITTAVFFAATVWRPVRPTPLLTDTGLR